MRVLITGSNGWAGRAITERLDGYEFTGLDREGSGATVVADVADYRAIRPAFDGQDAVVHLAGYPNPDGTWPQVLTNNVVGTHHVLEAARDASVEKVIFASSTHTVGRYEKERAPEIYDPDSSFTISPSDPVRPTNHYGASKACCEVFGRQYAEGDGPRFYALRLGRFLDEEHDHPYADAERAVETGRCRRDDPDYNRSVERSKARWLSRRDLAHLVDCALQDDTVEFEIFFGLSDNTRSWFDMTNTRERLAYDPQDNAEDWTAPP